MSALTIIKQPLRRTIVPSFPVNTCRTVQSLPAAVYCKHRYASTDASVVPDEAISQTPEFIQTMIAANQQFIETFHGAGLPWWASIVSATVCLRSVLTLPIAIYQQRAIGRMLAAAPIVQSWGETLKNQLAREGKIKGWEYERYNMELQKQVCTCISCEQPAIHDTH
jgi:membrane protein insertase Oxa1/YidC/SpoIIIJ